jgi:GNAT superfamily N-acetyltransferase
MHALDRAQAIRWTGSSPRLGDVVAIEVRPALPSELWPIINALPQGWYGPHPHLLTFQVTEMVRSGRMLLAHEDEEELAGVVGWQDDAAFGAMYAKFIFVKEKFRRQTVAARLVRELALTASALELRAIFVDFPDDSPLLTVADTMTFPGVRKAGHVDNFHEDGRVSVFYALDVRQAAAFIRSLDQLIEKGERDND